MARARMSMRRSGSRPNRSWSGSFATAYVVVPAASKVLLGVLATTVQADQTILCCVGGVSVSSDQAAAIEDQIGAIGLIIVTDIAGAAGIASVPAPITDAGDDGWFVHQSFAQAQSRVHTGGPTSTWYPIDSKAKRIFSSTGLNIAIVAENVHATNGMEVAVMLRILTQLRGTR